MTITIKADNGESFEEIADEIFKMYGWAYSPQIVKQLQKRIKDGKIKSKNYHIEQKIRMLEAQKK